MSIPAHITIGLLAAEAGLFCLAMLSRGSYSLWAFGGAASSILVMIGAVLGPLAILAGFFAKHPSVRKCGFALLILNTIPLAIVFILGHALFGDQYDVRRADETLRAETVEPQGGGYSPPAPRAAQPTP